MARKPVHTKDGPDARQSAWNAMRERSEFTVDDLERATGENNSTLHTYLQSLIKGGYVEMVGHDVRHLKTRGTSKNKTMNRPGIYRLVKNVGYHAPRLQRNGSPVTKGNCIQQMWRVMKVLSEFDFHDLAEAASGKVGSGDEVIVSDSTAHNYIKFLAKAGYLRQLVKGKPRTAGRYTLIKSKWSGPQAPMVQRVQHVYDPNLGKVVWPKDGDR